MTAPSGLAVIVHCSVIVPFSREDVMGGGMDEGMGQG